MIVRTDKATRTHVAFGDSLPDVVAYLNGTRPEWMYETSRTNRAEDAWDLGAGWDGTMRLARNGWSDGARELHRLLQAADIKNNRDKVERWGVAGYAPDVPRYLAGDPAHMRARSRRPDTVHKPIVSIVYNITANADISAKSLALMGSAMVAVVDQLENKGRRVDLSVAFCASIYSRKARCVTGWRVKRSEEHMDLAAVAFSVAHPAAMRRLCFAMEERSPADYYQPSYGHSSRLRPGELPDTDVDALIVDGLSAGGAPGSVVSAVALLAAQINKAAGEELIETTVKV